MCVCVGARGGVPVQSRRETRERTTSPAASGSSSLAENTQLQPPLRQPSMLPDRSLLSFVPFIPPTYTSMTPPSAQRSLRPRQRDPLRNRNSLNRHIKHTSRIYEVDFFCAHTALPRRRLHTLAFRVSERTVTHATAPRCRRLRHRRPTTASHRLPRRADT